MNELIDLITDLLSIPYVEEDSPVFDGSFVLVPYMANGLSGNGIVQTTTTMLYAELFYTEKATCIDSAMKLWKEIGKTEGMAAEQPEYIHEKDAHMWRGRIPIEIINKEEEQNASE